MRAKSIAVIIVAAGRGERASNGAANKPKQYQSIGGAPVLTRSIRAFLEHPQVNWVLPVIGAGHEQHYVALDLKDARLLAPVFGGASRQDSVLAGLQALEAYEPGLVLIHDGARPFVSTELIGAVVAALDQAEGVLPTLPVTDTIKRSNDGQGVTATEDRRHLFAAQTPQGFHFERIFSAHKDAANSARQFTDDAEIAEWAGLRVAMVAGERSNIKITHPEDFEQGERIISGNQLWETRIGTGYDVHPLVPGDGVWLGGVHIAHTARLQGHSDADVALHALTDAILGAIGEGDIGTHFPPADMQWKDAASVVFVQHAGFLVAKAGGRIVNLDVTIVAEQPKIAQHVPAMCKVIGEALGIEPSRIAVKATTNERLGFIGREEGIVAMASASIELPRRS